jgi:broad specificity phosphatase PhoE
MRLILVRHGETEHNRGGLTLGRADVPLNDRGRAQARAVAASFTRPPAAIYASPLARAHDTARAIGAATGVAVAVERDLIEMDVGEMEHLAGAELRGRYPDFLRVWRSGDAADARMPGGETLREVQTRAWAAIERMRAGHADAEIAAVTHNFVILTVVCKALNLPLREFRRVRHGLASRTVIDIRDGGATLIQLNDNAHLLAAGLADDLN